MPPNPTTPSSHRTARCRGPGPPSGRLFPRPRGPGDDPFGSPKWARESGQVHRGKVPEFVLVHWLRTEVVRMRHSPSEGAEWSPRHPGIRRLEWGAPFLGGLRNELGGVLDGVPGPVIGWVEKLRLPLGYDVRDHPRVAKHLRHQKPVPCGRVVQRGTASASIWGESAQGSPPSLTTSTGRPRTSSSAS